MPKWITVAFALFLSLHVFSTQARTVDEVITNHARATARMYRSDALPAKAIPEVTPATAARTVSGTSAKNNSPQMAAQDVSELVDYAAKGNKAVLAGKEVKQNRECYHVQLTLRCGQKADYYIDAENWRIIELWPAKR